MKARLPIGEITESFGEAFVEALDRLVDNGCQEMILEINSDGGDFYTAVRIVNALLNSGASVTALIDGLASSSASYIAAWCDAAFARPGSGILLHHASASVSGQTAAELDILAEEVRNVDRLMADAYARKSGLSDARVRALMARGDVLSAEEALKLKLIDGVLSWDEVDPPDPGDGLDSDVTRNEDAASPAAGRQHVSASTQPLVVAAATRARAMEVRRETAALFAAMPIEKRRALAMRLLSAGPRFVRFGGGIFSRAALDAGLFRIPARPGSRSTR